MGNHTPSSLRIFLFRMSGLRRIFGFGGLTRFRAAPGMWEKTRVSFANPGHPVHAFTLTASGCAPIFVPLLHSEIFGAQLAGNALLAFGCRAIFGLNSRKANHSMQIALKPKYEPSQLKVWADGLGSSLSQRSTKARNAKAKPSETMAAVSRSHSSTYPRSARAAANSYTPMLTAITTMKSATVRKAIGLFDLTSKPRALQTRPFSTRSHELLFLSFQMPAATVQAPIASASMPTCSAALLPYMNLRRVIEPSGLSTRNIMMENMAFRTPHSASSHQLL